MQIGPTESWMTSKLGILMASSLALINSSSLGAAKKNIECSGLFKCTLENNVKAGHPGEAFSQSLTDLVPGSGRILKGSTPPQLPQLALLSSVGKCQIARRIRLVVLQRATYRIQSQAWYQVTLDCITNQVRKFIQVIWLRQKHNYKEEWCPKPTSSTPSTQRLKLNKDETTSTCNKATCYKLHTRKLGGWWWVKVTVILASLSDILLISPPNRWTWTRERLSQ